MCSRNPLLHLGKLDEREKNFSSDYIKTASDAHIQGMFGEEQYAVDSHLDGRIYFSQAKLLPWDQLEQLDKTYSENLRKLEVSVDVLY